MAPPKRKKQSKKIVKKKKKATKQKSKKKRSTQNKKKRGSRTLARPKNRMAAVSGSKFERKILSQIYTPRKSNIKPVMKLIPHNHGTFTTDYYYY